MTIQDRRIIIEYKIASINFLNDLAKAFKKDTINENELSLIEYLYDPYFYHNNFNVITGFVMESFGDFYSEIYNVKVLYDYLTGRDFYNLYLNLHNGAAHFFIQEILKEYNNLLRFY